LVAITRNSDGSVTLTFDRAGGGTVDVVADYVLLAFPFTVLRFVDYAAAGFDARKDMAIQQQGGGVNGKLNLQFSRRLWNEDGPWGRGSGSSFSETGYQASWECTRGDPGAHGILVKYTGGDTTRGMRQRHPYGNALDNDVESDAIEALAQLEVVYPGISALWNGKAAGSMAHTDPRFYSSYAYYKVGQTTQIAGYERVRQGNVFFAGEHTSTDWLGYLDGAAAEGLRAGAEMVAAIGGGGRGGGKGGGKK
jgi:monoamine oxidase